MKRVTLFLLMSVTTLSLSCQPAAQNSNGNVNKNANSNDNGVEAFFPVPGDKTVAISVTEDLIQVSLPKAVLYLDPDDDSSKHERIRWCTYNNTEDKTIDVVKIEAKSSSQLHDPFEDHLPLTDNKNIGADDSHCTKKYRPKRPVGTFDYKVTVKFTDGTERTLDPQVIISDGRRYERSTGNSNANSNRR